MVFVRCDAKAASLETTLSPISDLLDKFDFPALEFDSTLDFVFDCNWKLYIENWLESYHLPWMHKAFIRDVNTDHYSVEVRDHAVSHKAERTSDRSVYAGAWVWLWPLTAWNSYDGGVSIERIIPDGPDRTRLEFTFLFSPAVGSERREATRDLCTTVTSEDGIMCEMVHRSVSRGRFVPGPLSPLHEGAIGYFHSLIRDTLAL
jgi:choline monooxygenase